MKYLPLSSNEKNALLVDLGIKKVEDLFRSIPEEIRMMTSDRLGAPMSEIELRRYFRADHSRPAINRSFMGGNGHHHYIPSVIDPLISRGEFLTAYTPYQPEISQGTLQAMFEYQSMMAELMGVEVSNASLYDGSSAMVEAALMACRITNRHHILVSGEIHPEYLETLKTYSMGEVFSYTIIPSAPDGRMDMKRLEAELKEHGSRTAAVLVQSPNVLGIIEDLPRIGSMAEGSGTLLVSVITEALSMGLLKSHGTQGAHIVCGEAQSFGIPLSYGGPWLGFIGTSLSSVRNLPGRIVGESVDTEGKRAFVITLAAREQHIRREKATSNICTNQGLMALRCAIHLSIMGKKGLRRAAERSARFAAYARKQVGALKGYTLPYPSSPIFNEFVVDTERRADEIFHACVERHGIAPGSVVGEHRLLVAFDETMSPETVDSWIQSLADAAGK